MSLVMPSSPHIFPTMLKVRKTPHKTKMWIICLIDQFVGISPKMLFFVFLLLSLALFTESADSVSRSRAIAENRIPGGLKTSGRRAYF